MAGTLDSASQRRSKLLEEHKAVKTQLQALDKATSAAAVRTAAATATAADSADVSLAGSPRHGASGKAAAAPHAGVDPADGSDPNSSADEKADAGDRKAAAAERQRQQRALHQRKKAICLELDQTRQAVRELGCGPPSSPSIGASLC